MNRDIQEKTPRERRTLRQLWELLKQNLKDWAWYSKEHPDRFTLDIQGGIRRLAGFLGERIGKLRRDIKRLARRERENEFPESERGFFQLLLFVWGSLPRAAAEVGAHLRHRRRRVHARERRKGRWENVKLHPVAFLSAALVIAALAVTLSLYTLGTAVRYDGTDLGTVTSKRAVNAVIDKLEKVTRQTLGDESYTLDRQLMETATEIVPRSGLEGRDELETKLSDKIGLVSYGYVLYVNDEPVVATTFPGALEELLEQMKMGYITANTVDSYFEENVEIRQEYVDASYMMNLGYIAEILNETKQGAVTYKVKSGDTYYGIADQYGISLKELLALNPGYNVNMLHVGDQLMISQAVPYLTVVNVERQNYISDVPYQIEYQDDAGMYQGETKVISAGQYGKADVTANVTYINGEEKAREVVASVTLRNSVTELQKRGTKERPTWYPSGSFGWPCYGSITDYFGYRSAPTYGASTYHEGIDISNSYGTPIYASDGGTVTRSSWFSGFGYYIEISHGNGFSTSYGHNSTLLVSAGEHVYKGQLIAYMGSTGISTGSHCDFRIYVNGTPVDPLNYLP
ncbi:MAG: M23 family metallopeptidase [Eubacteriales bacterium]|nr:M23 family metallopeptidase [Eubacteriales bacterium]